ncbi:hypothetical protein [Ramlibacter sp. WS9]|uniref:hypothetical protein n=1 Tax=Ramlibacter sp. WS9 TaxID=1882741 RepID=UPI00114514FB|nr:hypothetical protein [Ramlibacter sp. WS9]ROZ78265.1 hypothetical protein EEB15_07455 [Ramlibacter sp. WS9]
MTPAEGTDLTAKFVSAVKDLPAWLLTALAIAAGLLLFVPQINGELPKDYRPWLVVSVVLFGVLAAFKWINVLVAAWRGGRIEAKARKTFYMTPIAQHCRWSVAKQADGSLVTQIVADFAVKNQSAAPIGLMRVRIIKPKIRGEVLTDMITVREQRGHMHGTAHFDYRIAPGTSLPSRAMVMIRGKPRKDEGEDLTVVFGVSDEDGHEQHVRVVCKGMRKPKPSDLPIPVEALHAIVDPIEKDVASVLQTELSRYELNGRQAGGLGSVHIVMEGKEIKQLGNDMRVMQATTNQEIVSEAGTAEVKSDNLDALLALHGRLATDDERARFVNALLNRLQDDMGYACVAYLIVLVLWKIGLLGEALEAAMFGLPEDDRKDFGLSNALMMLNGLLRYRHPDFTPDMLDTIERFLQGSQEHSFRIPQKIAAIRAQRLLLPA